MSGVSAGCITNSYQIKQNMLSEDAPQPMNIASPKLALDIPALSTEKGDAALKYSPGVEGSIFYTGALKVLTFYSNFRFATTRGNNPFYEYLGKADKKAFALNQISFGFAITSTFRFSYTHYYGSTFVKDNFHDAFSFSVIPN